jgi:IS30 family transposase
MVSHELARNRQANGAYRAVVAQHRARQRARRPKGFKLERNRWLAREVRRLLERRWSPEQAAVELRRRHPGDPRWWVSAEAIYRSIYVQGRGGLRDELRRQLRLQRRARKEGAGRGRMPDAVHFSLRPAEARDRAVPGHREGDLLLGADGLSQVGMLAERSTRFTVLFALPADRTASTVRDALAEAVRSIPAQLRRSLTWDNGKEMARHAELAAATDMRVYFLRPRPPLAARDGREHHRPRARLPAEGRGPVAPQRGGPRPGHSTSGRAGRSGGGARPRPTLRSSLVQ